MAALLFGGAGGSADGGAPVWWGRLSDMQPPILGHSSPLPPPCVFIFCLPVAPCSAPQERAAGGGGDYGGGRGGGGGGGAGGRSSYREYNGPSDRDNMETFGLA